MNKFLRPEDMTLIRHPEIQTGRPFAFDVDEQGQLWQGAGEAALYRHDTRRGECELLPLHALRQRPVSAAACFKGQLVIVHQDCDSYTLFDPASRTSRLVKLPGSMPVVWYLLKACGKLLLFDRSAEGGILIMDEPGGPMRKLVNPWGITHASSGTLLDEHRVLMTLTDPGRMAFFDADRERFIEYVDFPEAKVGVSGRFYHDHKLYLADSSGGRLLVYDCAGRRWLEPLATPDYQQLYGFLGGGFQRGSVGYFCLSTYRFQSKLDPQTGKLILPEGWDKGVDGHPPRFLDRFLAYDAATGKFDYLVVPPQPDGIPLICYPLARGDEVYITGYVIPKDEQGLPTKLAGDWLVWQNKPLQVEPFNARKAVWPTRDDHRRAQCRCVPLSRSLYVVEPTHCPPPSNMQGVSYEYSPAAVAKLRRRLKVTDTQRYWKELAEDLVLPNWSIPQKAQAVGRFIKQAVYYNPISEFHDDPVTFLEAHNARCGDSVIIALRLFEAMNLQARQTNLRNHVVGEVFYDGGWHIQDSIIHGGYQPQKDGRVLSVAELQADPFFADAWPLDCFVYEPEEMRSSDGFYVLGYVFGEWGSLPYYSHYLGGQTDYPPTLPETLPAQRLDDDHVRLRWAPSIKKGGGAVEYQLALFEDRQLTRKVQETTVSEPWWDFKAQRNFMYHYTVQAVDDHRKMNPRTWYPQRRGNFMLVPKEQYGWYGVL